MQFVEDRSCRHLDPAMAFQLETHRMRNFDLEAIPITNHRMHLYMGKAKAGVWYILFRHERVLLRMLYYDVSPVFLNRKHSENAV